MTTEHKRFGPFIGGCIGGTLGYIAGAAFGPVAAVGMFFLGAYVGYDFKTAAKHFGRARTSLITHVQADGPNFANEARNFLRAVRKYWYAYAVWAVTTALCFNFMVGDSAMHQLNLLSEGCSPFTPGMHLPYTLDVLQTVVTGESRFFTEDIAAPEAVANPRLNAFALVFAIGIMASIFGVMLLLVLALLTFGSAMLARKLLKTTVAVFKTYRQWPLTVAWMLFWVLALPTLGSAWVMAATLTAIYTARRLACGLITVLAGMGYLFLVPMPESPELIGAAAIGCGVACGLTAYGLFALVGHPAVLARLRRLRERTFRSFSPLPTLPWWNALGERLADSDTD